MCVLLTLVPVSCPVCILDARGRLGFDLQLEGEIGDGDGEMLSSWMDRYVQYLGDVFSTFPFWSLPTLTIDSLGVLFRIAVVSVGWLL